MARRHVYTSYPTRRIVALGSHGSLAYYSFLAREWAELPLLFFIDTIWYAFRLFKHCCKELLGKEWQDIGAFWISSLVKFVCLIAYIIGPYMLCCIVL